MKKASYDNADQSSTQEAQNNPGGAEVIITPVPLEIKEVIFVNLKTEYSGAEIEREFVKLITSADATHHIMIAALLCSVVKESGADIVDGYTKGDFKRAIKELRIVQKRAPQYAAYYEDAISHIRREWLHREVTHENN